MHLVSNHNSLSNLTTALLPILWHTQTFIVCRSTIRAIAHFMEYPNFHCAPISSFGEAFHRFSTLYSFFHSLFSEQISNKFLPTEKERLAYIFNALELGIHGFTKFTRALCSAIEDRDQQLLELELENRTLVMRNSTLTIERDLLTKERDALDKEATHFVMRNSTITYERDEAIRERDGLKKEVDKLKGLNELLYNDAARERKALEERNESLYYDAARERDALEKEVEKLKEKNQSLHYGAGLERGILKTQLEQLKEEKKMLLRQNSNIETEVKKQNCQVTITKKERDDLRVAVDNMRCDAPYQVLARWMESPGYGF